MRTVLLFMLKETHPSCHKQYLLINMLNNHHGLLHNIAYLCDHYHLWGMITPMIYSQSCQKTLQSMQYLLFHLLSSSDVSHLTLSQPIPPTTQQPNTTAPPGVCLNVQCLNEGVCVVAEGKAACR